MQLTSILASSPDSDLAFSLKFVGFLLAVGVAIVGVAFYFEIKDKRRIRAAADAAAAEAAKPKNKRRALEHSLAKLKQDVQHTEEMIAETRLRETDEDAQTA